MLKTLLCAEYFDILILLLFMLNILLSICNCGMKQINRSWKNIAAIDRLIDLIQIPTAPNTRNNRLIRTREYRFRQNGEGFLLLAG